MDTYTLLMLGNLFIIAFWAATDPRPYQERLKYFIKPQRILFWSLFITVFYTQYLIYYYYPEFLLNISPSISSLGFIIFTVGILFASWAKITMRTSWGVSGEHNIKRQNKLISSGPFKYSRNPIYAGLFLVLLGFFLALNSPLIFLLLPLALIIDNIVIKEEVLLKNHFKNEYTSYMTKVRRYL